MSASHSERFIGTISPLKTSVNVSPGRSVMVLLTFAVMRSFSMTMSVSLWSVIETLALNTVMRACCNRAPATAEMAGLGWEVGAAMGILQLLYSRK